MLTLTSKELNMSNKVRFSKKILCVLLIFIVGMLFILYEIRFNKTATFTAIYETMVQQTRAAKPKENTTYVLKENATKWIVVTTIKYPSPDIEKLTKIDGWQLLVVGDLKTPKNWTYPGCVFLGIEEQKKLGFKIAKNLPSNSYTRKIMGYLYAIKHGAKYIYDTDDDNHPTDGKINFYQQENTSGLIYNDVTRNVMNPYAHFGQPSIWPRGYPLDKVDKLNNNTYKLCTFKTPAIQQGLVNGDPDVDAIFRLTRKAPNQRYINVTFDARAPPVTLPEGVFAPFNSQNTFFTYEAFWALFLPTSVAFRVTDIWRGYWAQRLLWLIGQRLSFFPPNAVQFRNSHDYLDDFKDENQFYLQTDSFVEFLKKWTCSKKTFFKCIRLLGYQMADKAFWDKSDAKLLDSWLSDLYDIGYREPQMKDEQSDCKTSTTVYYSSAMNSGQSLRSLGEFCGRNCSDISSKSLSKPEVVHDELLLIVVFNSSFYGNILDTLYADHFPNVVYCGGPSINYTTLSDRVRESSFPWQERRVSFINTKSERGYDCAIYAMQMNYDVEGFIVIEDNVLLNFWNLRSLNFSNPQMQLSVYRVVDLNRDPKKTWYGWNTKYGRSVANQAMDELQTLAQNHPDENSRDLIKNFFQNRAEANFNASQISLSLGDIYYVPRSFSNMFVEIAKVFLKHEVFLEIAIPTTITGLTPHALLQGFTGTTLMLRGARNESLKNFNATLHYLHPVELSSISNENNGLVGKTFCETYVKSWFENW